MCHSAPIALLLIIDLTLTSAQWGVGGRRRGGGHTNPEVCCCECPHATLHKQYSAYTHKTRFIYFSPFLTPVCTLSSSFSLPHQEIVDKDGQSKVLSFTVPSLSKPSVYHEVRRTREIRNFLFIYFIREMFNLKMSDVDLSALGHRLHGPDGRGPRQSRLEPGGVQRATPPEGKLYRTKQVTETLY